MKKLMIVLSLCFTLLSCTEKITTARVIASKPTTNSITYTVKITNTEKTCTISGHHVPKLEIGDLVTIHYFKNLTMEPCYYPNTE